MNNEYNKEDLYECDEDGCVYKGNLFTDDEETEEENDDN